MSAPLNALTSARLERLRTWLEHVKADNYRIVVLPPGADETDATLAASCMFDELTDGPDDGPDTRDDRMSLSSTCGALDIQVAGHRFYFYAGLES